MALPDPIAIVGMAMRLPGNVNNSTDFWNMLVEKRDGRIRVPKDRYNVDAFHSSSGKLGTVNTQYGNFLQGNLKHLDTSFFSMTRSETEKLDPQARLLLEVSREVLENAGETQWQRKQIGCYVGVFGEDWQDIHLKDSQDSGMYRATGYGDFLIGNRVSYENNLKGPSMTVKTGCSSSLIALHLACRAIANHECSAAIVAGTNLIMTPTTTIAMSEQGVLSPDSRCKTFDANANGYARGEAINALYIKPLSAAIRDGNPIQSIIRGTASNCDGRTPGISHPSVDSHEAVMRLAVQAAGLSCYDDVGFVECHGTGTAIGDPLEAGAVARVFGDKGIHIGSHKPNFGHSEGASGVTGVIKAALALKHQTIPPNINFENPNPKIPFDKLTVPTEAIPWPKGKGQRAVVNSFGLGGANASVVLESPSLINAESRQLRSPSTMSSEQLLVFSANHANSLSKLVENSKAYLSQHPHSAVDLAYTLGARREHLPFRSFTVTGEEAVDGSTAVTPNTPQTLKFVFTGQGAQWAGMGKELRQYPAVLENVRRLDRVLQALPDAPSWLIECELFSLGDGEEDENIVKQRVACLEKAEFAQPLCTALQIVIVNLLESWGITPDAVVGHSSGEIAAAYAAKAITEEAAITIAFYRGLMTKLQARKGGMAAVGLGREAVTPFLKEGVVIACENSPSSVTLSGDAQPLEDVVEDIKMQIPGTFARALRVQMAYHSNHMQTIGRRYEQAIEGHVAAKKPRVAFYSSVTGDLVSEENVLLARYWRQNLESPVLFYRAVQSLMQRSTDDQVFMEIGPHSALQGPLRQIFKASASVNAAYIPTLVRNSKSVSAVLQSVGQLFMRGIPIDFGAMAPGKVLSDLQPYPWHHEAEYWDESRVARDWRLRPFNHHELLGSRITHGSELVPTWRNMLRVDDVPWIRDHQISTDVIFPGAGYVSMAGEAVRQLTGTPEFTVRAVNIASALVVSESAATEILTTLQPYRLTDSLESVWYDFSIDTCNGTIWTRNCFGQVRPGSEHELKAVEFPDLPRRIHGCKWYEAMRQIKLNYGPRFQGLEDISADTVERVAKATMHNDMKNEESVYQLHPTTIDFCFQLFGVASAWGQPRNLRQLCVPTYIQTLYVARPEGTMEMSAEASASSRGVLTGDGVATANGKVVMDVKGLKMTPVENGESLRSHDCNSATRLYWKPHIDFCDLRELIRPPDTRDLREFYVPLERLVLLCIIESRDRSRRILPSQGHLDKYKAWLDIQVRSASLGNNVLVQESGDLVAMSSEGRMAEIMTLTHQLMQSPLDTAALAVRCIFDSCQDILEGKADPLELLLEDDILTRVYNIVDPWDHADFLQTLCHSKPWLRVLEIGAGTGGTTAAVLDHLSSHGERMYGLYHYTDISAGFFMKAKERFAGYSNLEYAVLDITKNPAEQGFELESYDLIIAANVLHATPRLSETLGNVYKLLRPDGHLLLYELCPAGKYANYIMGTLSGWWLGEEDGRTWEPYIPPERWAKELSQVGFDTPAIFMDGMAPYQFNALLVSSPKAALPPTVKTVMLLCDEIQPLALADQVELDLRAAGHSVKRCTIYDTPQPNQEVVALIDIADAFFEKITEHALQALVKFLQQIDSDSGVLWCTRSAQVRPKDPRWSQTLGFARTVRNELGVHMATLELDHCGDRASDAIVRVWSKFQQRSTGEEDYNPEYEYALDNNKILIGRFHWFSIKQELSQVKSDNKIPKRLEIGKQGLIGTLGWVQQPPRVLEGDQVEVDVRAVGMNFRDVLVVQGIVEGHSSNGDDGLGCECAGIIRDVGPDVDNVAVGDRVMVFAGGSYATRLLTRASLCARIPSELSYAEAATMPCVYSTVIYSLLHLCRLRKGQTILIHSACGGVGIAAIHICQMIGAKIYATVGTEAKVNHLMETYGIPREHIFHSRDPSFHPKTLEATKGRGVDVVLNSLSGELLHASWKCVAPYGSMVEIGKRDLIGHGKLSMEMFKANRAFFGVDLAEICSERADLAQQLLEECVEYYRKGAVRPITPLTRFPAEKVEEAFRFMQKGSHIGKIVIDVPEDHEALAVAARKDRLSLRPDCSYLLVGGLGGLGRAVSTWLVENGAKNLVYLSRSAGEAEDDQAFFRELRSMGCSTQAFPGNVATLDDVQRAINGAHRPVMGVLQMAMVLKDGPLNQVSIEDWETVVLPKVDGTWNLHEATKNIPLDFMVMFGSISGLVGQNGQANYASANAFLDAFVQYRQASGLAASVLEIGPIEDIGYISTHKTVMGQLRATSVCLLKESDLLDPLHAAIKCSQPEESAKDEFVNGSQIAIGLRMTVPPRAPSNRCAWRRDRRMAAYHNLPDVEDSANVAASDTGLRQFLSEAAANPGMLREASSVEMVTMEVAKTLCDFLLLPVEEVDITRSISSMGVDSLVAIELRNWCRHKMGIEMTVLQILELPTLEAFGQAVAQQLYSKLSRNEEHVRDSYLSNKTV